MVTSRIHTALADKEPVVPGTRRMHRGRRIDSTNTDLSDLLSTARCGSGPLGRQRGPAHWTSGERVKILHHETSRGTAKGKMAQLAPDQGRQTLGRRPPRFLYLCHLPSNPKPA